MVDHRIVSVLCSIALLFAACSNKVLDEPPLHYSFFPKKLDLDSVKSFVKVTPEPVLVIPNFPDTAKYRDFPSINLNLSTLTLPDTLRAKGGNGVLISPRLGKLIDYYMVSNDVAKSYMEYYRTSNEANLSRLNNAKFIIDLYYDQAKAAEVLYQNEILRLRKDVKRSWFERNMAYIGFASGVAAALLTEWAVSSIAR